MTTRWVIRVDDHLTDDMTNSLPHLSVRHHRPSTTLTGEIVDQQQLQGLLSVLESRGITVLQIVTLPGD